MAHNSLDLNAFIVFVLAGIDVFFSRRSFHYWDVLLCGRRWSVLCWSQLLHVRWYTAFLRKHNPMLEIGHLSLVHLCSVEVCDRAHLRAYDSWAMRTGMFSFLEKREIKPLSFISRSSCLSPFFSLSFADLSPTFSFSLSFSFSVFQICGHGN